MVNETQLNTLRPKLKSCLFLVGGKSIVIEEVATERQVVIPKEHKRILDLCDGQNSIKDISSKLYNADGDVSFNSILTTIRRLDEAGLIEGMQAELKGVNEDSAQDKEKPSILHRPILKLKLFNKIQLSFMKSDFSFYGLSAFLLGFVLLNYELFLNIKLSEFLRSDIGYDEALLRIFAICSGLMAMKVLIKGSLLFLSTGNFYDPSIQLYPYGLTFQLNDNSIFSHPKKRVLLTFGVVSASLYIICASFLSLVPFARAYMNDVLILSILLSFIEVDPYQKSEMTKIFHSFKLKDLFHFVFAMIWAIGFTAFTVEMTFESIPHIFKEIQADQLQHQISAFAVLAFLSFIDVYLIAEIGNTIMQNLFSPVRVPAMKIQKKVLTKDYKQDDFSFQYIKDNFKKNMLFNQLSDAAIDFLIKNSTARHIKKGTYLILQGDDCRDVYFLLRGKVEVNVREKNGRIKHVANLVQNTVVGERAILEQCKRTANVIATEDLVFLDLPAKVFAELMQQEAYKTDSDKLRSRIQISQFVASASLFKDFPVEIMNLFVEVGDLIMFPGGHNIVEEGEKDRTFYLLISGKVDVYKNKKRIAALEQGDFFGEIALMANVPRTATVKTIEDSLFLCIEDKNFWKILSNNLELGLYIESVGRHRLVEAA